MKKLIVSLIVLAICSTPALARPVTWDGGGDGYSWDDGSNWQPNGVPTTSDDIVINAPGTTIVGYEFGVSDVFNTLDFQAGTYQGACYLGYSPSTGLTISGGRFEWLRGQVGRDYDATLTLNSGDVIAGDGMFIGEYPGFPGYGTFNMNGGYLEIGTVGFVHTNGEFNFTGGTIRIEGDHLPFSTDPCIAVWFTGSPNESFDGTYTWLVGCDLVGTVDPASLTVYENASQGTTTGTFTVVLDSSPGATDTITVDIDPNSNGNGDDVTVNGSSAITLTFTSADWDTPQTVTVTSIDDTWADGNLELDAIGFTVTSAESGPCYANACLTSVGVTIVDDDSPGIIVSKTDASIAEGGAGDSYTIQLSTAPTNPVTIIVAADYSETSPTDSNMIIDPFDCQLTVNGGGSDTLVFTLADTPQTVTVAAVDDGMVEADPHSITIDHFVVTDDVFYSTQSANNVDVSITDNDARAWIWDDDVLLSLPPNSSFETPVLSEGQSYVNSDPNYGPFGTSSPPDYFEGALPISHISDPCWALMYEVGQTVPDGDNVLVMPGNEAAIQYLSYTTRPCEYLIEPGPVSYTLTVAVGLPKEAGGAANPSAYAQFEFWVPGLGQIASTGGVIGQLTPGEWQDITLCSLIPADAVETGLLLSIELWGEHVQFDNVRLSVGNHPCPGHCDQDITEAQGDLDDDCDVDLADFAILAGNFLECYSYPGCMIGW